MTEPILLRRIVLSATHRPTGQVRHFRWGELLPPPYELRIVKYEDAPGYYLFYCNENGTEMSDTYHDSIQQAMEQAKSEFNVLPNEWAVPS
jgi:hypothetical protein